jgi:hypothetical protein
MILKHDTIDYFLGTFLHKNRERGGKEMKKEGNHMKREMVVGRKRGRLIQQVN